MSVLRKKVDQQGRISIKKFIHDTNIKPGDEVEVIPGKNQIVIKTIRKSKSSGIVEKVAGKWENRPDLVADLLNIRKEEDREVPGVD